MNRLKLGFLADEQGATAIEYALICAVIFLVIIAAVTATATETTDMFTLIAGAVG